MPLVLVHGVPQTPVLWDPLRSCLGRRDVVALQLPGFGCAKPEDFDATKEDYVRWLIREVERLQGQGPIDVVGHDWGGGFVVRTVSTRADLVRSWVTDAASVGDARFEWHDFAKIRCLSRAGPGDGRRRRRHHGRVHPHPCTGPQWMSVASGDHISSRSPCPGSRWCPPRTRSCLLTSPGPQRAGPRPGWPSSPVSDTGGCSRTRSGPPPSWRGSGTRSQPRRAVPIGAAVASKRPTRRCAGSRVKVAQRTQGSSRARRQHLGVVALLGRP
ncbi:MAG: alpha/beta fold hydrolase [Acidimicrobiales bacterium]